MKEQYRKELINIMEELVENGFRCFILKEDNHYVYGFVISPSDNVLYIQRDSFEWRGWTITLKYWPDKNNGGGCLCFENPITDITPELMFEAEREGLDFAHKLGATLYNNSDEFFENLWNIHEFEEII